MTDETETRKSTELETRQAIDLAEAARNKNKSHEVVLVVDDNYAQNSAGLSNDTRTVIPAYSFCSAMEIMQKEHIDYLLSDVEIPVIDEEVHFPCGYYRDIKERELGNIVDYVLSYFSGNEGKICELENLTLNGKECMKYILKEENNYLTAGKRAVKAIKETTNLGLRVIQEAKNMGIQYTVVTSTGHGNIFPALVALEACSQKNLIDKLSKYVEMAEEKRDLYNKCDKKKDDVHYELEEEERTKIEQKIENINNKIYYFEERIDRAIIIGKGNFDKWKDKDLDIWQRAYELAKSNYNK